MLLQSDEHSVIKKIRKVQRSAFRLASDFFLHGGEAATKTEKKEEITESRGRGGRVARG